MTGRPTTSAAYYEPRPSEPAPGSAWPLALCPCPGMVNSMVTSLGAENEAAAFLSTLAAKGPALPPGLFVGTWAKRSPTLASRLIRPRQQRPLDPDAFWPSPNHAGTDAKPHPSATVELSAVRDLYGTVVHEGANRGILMTTSGFGGDA
jgi:hypothetical protein